MGSGVFMSDKTQTTAMLQRDAHGRSVHRERQSCLLCFAVLLLVGVQGCEPPQNTPEPDEISGQRLAFKLHDLIPLANGIDVATERMAVCDVDRDGRLDLAIPDNSSATLGVDGTPVKNQSLLILYGQDSGWPAPPRQLPTQQVMQAAYAVRLHKDGRVSLLLPPKVFLSNGFDTLYLLLGAQGGGLSRRTVFVAEERMTQVAVGDLDGDRLDDLGALSPALGKVSLYRGMDGGGFTTRRELEVGTEPALLLLTDANGDGRVDLIVLAQSADRKRYVVNTLLATASGYQALISSPVAGKPIGAVATDLNKDGAADLLVALRLDDSHPEQDVLAVFGGDKAGTFKETSRIGAPMIVVPTLRTDDLDADGNLDLIFAVGGDSSQLRVGLGNGDRSFQTPQTLAILSVPAEITALTAVDHDGDGRIDLDVVLAYDRPRYVRTLAVLRNISAARRTTKE